MLRKRIKRAYLPIWILFTLYVALLTCLPPKVFNPKGRLTLRWPALSLRNIESAAYEIAEIDWSIFFAYLFCGLLLSILLSWTYKKIHTGRK
jgi:hypothetical protein